MKGSMTTDGRPYVTLSRNRKATNQRVCRLVLMAFVGPCPPGQEACHDPDPDPTNNRLENLRWDTRKGNHADKAKHGTSQRGERHNLAKLSEAAVKEIRRIYKKRSPTFGSGALARRFGVCRSAIISVVKRQTWSHERVDTGREVGLRIVDGEVENAPAEPQAA